MICKNAIEIWGETVESEIGCQNIFWTPRVCEILNKCQTRYMTEELLFVNHRGKRNYHIPLHR